PCVLKWVVFSGLGVPPGSAAAHPRSYARPSPATNRISQAHNTPALVAASSAWVPGVRAGKGGSGGGAFSSGCALAFRPSVPPFLHCERTHIKASQNITEHSPNGPANRRDML